MDSDEENQPQLENPAIENVETKAKALKNKVRQQPKETKEPIQNKPSPIQPSKPTVQTISASTSSPPITQPPINADEANTELDRNSNTIFILPFSKQQTVAMGIITLALFIKSLETLIALREIPDGRHNEVFYGLIVLLCIAMFLNFCNAAILVRLGIKKDDEKKQTCEPCECCGPYMWKPRYMSSEQLIYMCSVLTLLIFLIEISVAVLHINVFSKLNG